jgi:lambda repressor-like predicted transcriptional regulator
VERLRRRSLASGDKRAVRGTGAGRRSTARKGDSLCPCCAPTAFRQGVPVSVAIHPGVLRREMARRGWDATELAKQSRLSQATVSTALAGRPIAAKSVALIAKALQRVPPSEVIDSLILYRTKDVELD